MKRVTPTLQDVAIRAGLSKAAVSRYLNGTLKLPAETEERIKAAILSLDYRRNSLARRLSKGGSETLGLIIPEISNSFFAELAEASEEEAASRGYNLILGISRNNVDKEVSFLRWIDAKTVDGLLFTTNHPDPNGILAREMSKYEPIVILDEDIKGTPFRKIFCDNESGAFSATMHLIKTGHRHIAHVTGLSSLMSVRERIKGYERALHASGLHLQSEFVFHGDYSRSFGRTAAARIAHHNASHNTQPIDAIFAASDYLAIGLLEGLRKHNIRVPQDISIVGFDDTAAADLVTPRLTTVKQSASEFGRLGIQLLVDYLTKSTKSLHINEPLRINTTLVIRDTVSHRM